MNSVGWGSLHSPDFLSSHLLNPIHGHRSMTFEYSKTRLRDSMLPVLRMTLVRACAESRCCEHSHPGHIRRETVSQMLSYVPLDTQHVVADLNQILPY